MCRKKAAEEKEDTVIEIRSLGSEGKIGCFLSDGNAAQH